MDRRTKPFAMGLAVVNGGNADAASDYIARNLVGGQLYRFQPSGGIVGAAFDLAILYVAGSIASIAQFLWHVYDRVIATKTGHKSDSPVLYISIDPEEGLEWMLGRDVVSEEEFVGDFEARVHYWMQTTRSEERLEEWEVTLSDTNWRRKP